MPLSQAANRELTHTRVVTCHGYRRKNGLLDIEGRIVDTKPYRFRNKDRGGWIEAGEALHDMSIRLTINLDLEVVDVEAVIDASPYNYCKCVTPVTKNLIGLKIEPGWTQKSKKAMGANRGCTHLTELLGPIATTAIQTVSSENIKRCEKRPQGSRNAYLNTCHAYADFSPVIKEHWPQDYQSG